MSTSPTDNAEISSRNRRLTEIHILAARERALRLFMAASTVFPHEWTQSREIIEPIIVDAGKFAYHARRVIELCGFRERRFESVNETRFNISPGQNIIFIADFHEALNRLLHAQNYAFNWAVREKREKIFLSSPKELVPSFVNVSTDRREEANISLFGVTFAFLNGVIKAIKEEFPSYVF